MDALGPFLEIGIFLVLALVVVVFVLLRRKRMQQVLVSPESEEERRQRLLPPANLQQLSPDQLLQEAREDLQNAESYLESAFYAVKDARFWSWLDIFGIDAEVGGRRGKLDQIDGMQDELMHAEQFLGHARHKLTCLKEKEGPVSEVPTLGLNPTELDWMLDNPIFDLQTHRRLGKIKKEIEQLRQKVQQWLDQLPPA